MSAKNASTTIQRLMRSKDVDGPIKLSIYMMDNPPISQKIFNEVFSFFMREDSNLALGLTRNNRELASKGQLKKLLQTAIRQGDLKMAEEATEWMGRELDSKEIDEIARILMISGRVYTLLDLSRRYWNRELERPELDVLITASLRTGNFEATKKIVELRGQKLSMQEVAKGIEAEAGSLAKMGIVSDVAHKWLRLT